MAGKQLGRLLLVKIATGSSAYATLCGLTTKTVTVNNNEIDVTTADCDEPGGPLWTEVLSGTKRVSVSGNGLFEDSAAEKKLIDLAMAADSIAQFQIILPDFGTFTGSFHLASQEYGGEQEGGMTYSLTLNSSGPVEWAPEAAT
ncbi:phage major tail protein, TP901-1 family [Pseudoroseicyclus aestuarii]|uniref:TP901-1 family phage major tail protein n=1 Tax=Pseudoroseicyclus aestuarii TaxID=1795041 RepID=A0A318SMA6_9RHOB|nr:phage major tail protein, TP901-1 family [Pseudoroseicyclus aestuarii]PYE80815.1 TP901-1 family phage major tail protein [Pseudoroseicyclus aestuarii]